MFKSLLRMFSRALTKLIFFDGLYYRQKFLLQHAIHGPQERLSVGLRTDLNDTVFNTMGGRIKVGDYSFFGHGCMVLTGRHDYTSFLEDRRSHKDHGGDVIIGQGVWIGSGAILLGPLRIGDHAVIGAGALVTHDCEPGGIYLGVPARLTKTLEPGALKALKEC